MAAEAGLPRYVELSSPSAPMWKQNNIQSSIIFSESSALLVSNPKIDRYEVKKQFNTFSKVLPSKLVLLTLLSCFLFILFIEIFFIDSKDDILSSQASPMSKFPFDMITRETPVPSSLFWASHLKAPFPTGAWFSNLAVGDGDQIIVALPYQFKIDHNEDVSRRWGGGLQVSYGPLRREASEEALIDWYGVDLCIQIKENSALTTPVLENDGEVAYEEDFFFQSHEISRYDSLTVDVEFKSKSGDSNILKPKMKALLARGSPYVTVEFERSIPVIDSMHELKSFEKVDLSSYLYLFSLDADGGELEETVKTQHVQVYRVNYELSPSSIQTNTASTNDGSKLLSWLLFFVPSKCDPINVDCLKEVLLVSNAKYLGNSNDGNSISTTQVFTGTMRAALIPPHLSSMGSSSPAPSSTIATLDSPVETLLIKHSGVVPIASTISWELNPVISSSSPSDTILHENQVSCGDTEVDNMIKAFNTHQSIRRVSNSEEATYSFNWETINLYAQNTLNIQQDAPSVDATFITDSDTAFTASTTTTTTNSSNNNNNNNTATTASEKDPFVVMKTFSDLLLGIALPHHVNTIDNMNVDTSDCYFVGNDLSYITLKGKAVGLVGNIWSFREQLTNIDFFSSKSVRDSPANVEALNKALRDDFTKPFSGTNPEGKLVDPKWVDPYGFGKAIAKIARLALIAEENGNITQHKQALESLYESLTPWLMGSNSDHFVYDQTWGGIISNDGVNSQEADFGNGWYNDHHFHYGYFLYAAAVLIRGNESLLQASDSSVSKIEIAIESLLRDIANPIGGVDFDGDSLVRHQIQSLEENEDSVSAENDLNLNKRTPYRYFRSLGDKNMFPLVRHQDWFDGHSWASGVFPMNNGKSQESVSEAINAYYAVHLLGKAVGDEDISKWGRLLLAREIRAAHWYWQMGAPWSPYPEVFTQSKMVGVVGSSDAKVWTWFGSNPEFVHGINMMPFTPITEELLGFDYVTAEFPVLESRLDSVSDQWKGLIELARAVIDSKASFKEILPLSANKIDGFDAGNSLSNSLYWILTRPNRSHF